MNARTSRRLLTSVTAIIMSTATLLGAAPLAGATSSPTATANDRADVPPPDVPFGFLDGVPVGGEDAEAEVAATAAAESTGAGASARTPMAATSAVTTRYFGRGAWDGIRQAAQAAARPCQISTDEIIAMMVAPVFKESSGATSPSTAPSPMTLSRADEWSGVMADTTNLHANYGLYENRDPYTPYQRAYWHPGIGIWQYDDSGVGAPFTAVERMDTAIVGADVARGMVSRYCGSSSTDPFVKRRAAWSPWGSACTTSNPTSNFCEVQFTSMLGGNTPFENIVLVDGIGETGGAVKRTCRIDGATLPCWFVDPAKAEGARGWTFNPMGDPSPTTVPTPLSFPFYVISRSGKEERHWLRDDTGYPVDISAVRTLGRNSRPRSSSPGSGLTWSRTSGLCDVTAARGNCGVPPPTGPVLPAGVRSTPLAVSGSYRTVVLDVDGNGRDDVLWYAPGTAPDHLWLNRKNGSFASMPLTINGSYDYVVPLDADGDGRDDIVWYSSTSGVAYLWRSQGNGTFLSTPFVPGPGLQPFAVDRGGRGRHSLFVYGPGKLREAWWDWNGRAMVNSAAEQMDGTYKVFVGDFDGNHRDDIFWYAPGAAADHLWLHRVAGGHVDVPQQVLGAYRPLVGDHDGDGIDDIVWYQPGSTVEQIWWGAAGANFAKETFTVNSEYDVVVADVEGDGRDDLIWYDSTSKVRHLWTRWTSDRRRISVAFDWAAGYRAVGGAFGAEGGGMIWYGPGALADSLWTR